jgi:hypothetical protein
MAGISIDNLKGATTLQFYIKVKAGPDSFSDCLHDFCLDELAII